MLDANNLKEDPSVRKEFYLELSYKLEDMFNKSKTYGEVTLMGDLIGLLNSKLKDSNNN